MAIQIGLVTDHIINLRQQYKKSLDEMYKIIKKEAPFVNVERPKGGYFFWLQLPKDFDGFQIAKRCEEDFQVLVFPGSIFSCNGNFKNYLRVSYSHYSSEMLCKATKSLCKTLNETFKHLEPI